MFKFLKDKLKSAVSIFSKKAETESSEEVIEQEKEIVLDDKSLKDEELKLEEEKKKKEEELRKLEEEKKKEEERLRKEEEARLKREEQLRIEEEKKLRKEEEERLKKEAELQRLEEEQKKKEEELKKAKESEKKKKEEELKRLEEDRKRKEEERRRLEEERKKEEERRRKEEQEKLRIEEELRIKEEERLRREEEERKKKEEELRKLKEKEAEVKEKKGFFAKLKEKFIKKKEPEKPEVIKHEDKEVIIEAVKEEPEHKGFFAKVKEKITTKKISSEQFDELFWELELALLENNVAVEVIEKIKQDLKQKLVDVPIRKSELQEVIIESLRESIESLFKENPIDLVREVKRADKPYVIVFVGVNGSGKTTSIAKVAHMMLKNGLKPIIAASDTFRAAAIQQLEEHGKKLGVKVIKHDYGADPSAVAFDAIKAAQAHKLDVVLVDTAGRMHSNQNLQDEMKKIVRVTKPNMKIFVAEAIAGNDATIQSIAFDKAIDIDGVILAKSDVDEKGGAIVSISYVTGKPILYLGTGQDYGDLEKFDPKTVLQRIGL
ncbi:signal recognition particle-docking protein FtsY [Candidatus Woesearchaeota archaeon]|nr:signal recognition particle-docking protein FtsY [Candidatus Woesearchaeota archaeon]